MAAAEMAVTEAVAVDALVALIAEGSKAQQTNTHTPLRETQELAEVVLLVVLVLPGAWLFIIEVIEW